MSAQERGADSRTVEIIDPESLITGPDTSVFRMAPKIPAVRVSLKAQTVVVEAEKMVHYRNRRRDNQGDTQVEVGRQIHQTIHKETVSGGIEGAERRGAPQAVTTTTGIGAKPLIRDDTDNGGRTTTLGRDLQIPSVALPDSARQVRTDKRILSLLRRLQTMVSP
jgi:hypothetical protein